MEMLENSIYRRLRKERSLYARFGGRPMLKEYRKTATIKAEQFDGSDAMIEKFIR